MNSTHDSSDTNSDTEQGAPTMRAVVGERYGSPEQLVIAEVPRPTAGDGQVLIEVAAAGVDRGVWHLVTGLPYAVRVAGFGLRRPKQPIPGMDVAGTVVEVGAGVDGFAIGDEVYGVASGSYAEYAVADAAKLTHRPASMPAEVAATIAISGGTAAQALFDVGRAQPGQRVLVLGASGGVGSFVTQLAHRHGLHVTGVASAAKAELVRSLGADVVLDYATQSFADEAPFDLIIDTGGRNRLSVLRRSMTKQGTLVIVGGEDGGRFTGGAGRQLRGMLLSPFVSQRLTTFVAGENAAARAALHDLVVDGAVTPAIARTYPLDQAADAIADLAAGRIAGKAVVTVR
jgi:NADPH:quinone reductase-like Zn-dependent oxidoreductase